MEWGALRSQPDTYNEIKDMIKFLKKRNYAPFSGRTRLDLALWSGKIF